MFVRPFQGPTDPCLCPGASRKAARPRLLTFVLSGRENLPEKQELDHLLHREHRDTELITNLDTPRRNWPTP